MLVSILYEQKLSAEIENISIIIDPNGEIAFLTRLFDHDEFNEMKTVIDKLLNKKN